MRRSALDATRDDRHGSLLLGTDHPIARTIDGCQSTKRQCAVVAAIMVGGIRPAVEGHSWAISLTVAAAITLAGLMLALAARYQAIRDRAIELIAHGQDTLAVDAIQAQRRRLLRPRTRAGLARCLDGMVRQANTPRSRQLWPASPLFDYRVVEAVSREMETVAALLRGGRSPAPGVARVEWLITHAGSPLYGHEAGPLHFELQEVCRLLAGDGSPDPQLHEEQSVPNHRRAKWPSQT